MRKLPSGLSRKPRPPLPHSRLSLPPTPRPRQPRTGLFRPGPPADRVRAAGCPMRGGGVPPLPWPFPDGNGAAGRAVEAWRAVGAVEVAALPRCGTAGRCRRRPPVRRRPSLPPRCPERGGTLTGAWLPGPGRLAPCGGIVPGRLAPPVRRRPSLPPAVASRPGAAGLGWPSAGEFSNTFSNPPTPSNPIPPPFRPFQTRFPFQLFPTLSSN